MSRIEPDDQVASDAQCQEFLAAYDEALIGGSSVPVFDQSTVPLDAPRIRGLQNCLDLLAEGRRSGELAAIFAACRTNASRANDCEDLPDLDQVGAFEIRRELGRGGYGLVFLALDPRANRLVALKVPRPEALVTPELRRRFLREGQAAGRLSHPNLVAVHEVGEDGPLCYIASSYCAGPTLAQWLARHPGVVPVNDAATTIAAVADGVDYAHQQGVLHRDIKPSNVLLKPGAGVAHLDEPQRSPLTAFDPQLTDFGLAKILEQDQRETRSGMLLGTPAYMAPEQAVGNVRDIGPATDVYALGVLLYELLAKRPPFRGANDPDTLRQVCLDDPPSPSRMRPGLPRDLEAICLKCLAKASAQRYDSAADLARDLRRFLAGEPTLARPTGTISRAVKWSRRRPAIAALMATLLLAALVLGGGGWWYSGRLGAALAEAQTRADENRQFLYVAIVNLAERALNNGNIRQAQEQLARAIPAAHEPDLRDFSWRHLDRQLHEEERTLTGHQGNVYCVRFSADGRVLATAGADKTARVWDPATGKCLQVFAQHEDEVNSVSLSPDGTLLASASDDGRVRIWDLRTGKLQRELTHHVGGASDVAFSPDGKRLATCGRNQPAILWNASTWKQLRLLAVDDHAVNALAFAPNGRTLAAASDDKTVQLWDADSGELLRTLQGHGSVITALAFSSHGNKLVTAGREDRTVRVWDVSTGLHVRELSREYGWVHAIQICREDRQIAVATKDGELKLIEVGSGDVARDLHGHWDRIWSLSVSPDGRQLADASADGTVKIWNLERGASHEIAFCDEEQWDFGKLTADGLAVVKKANNWQTSVLRPATGELLWQGGRDFQIAGDFNGDGIPDDGYFQDGTWYLQISRPPSLNLAASFTERVVNFGTVDDIPIIGDWDGNGRDDLGVYRPSTFMFLHDLDGEGGASEASRGYFRPAHLTSELEKRSVPLVGRWLNEDCDMVGLAAFTGQGWQFHLLRGDSNEYKILLAEGDETSVPIAGKMTSGPGDDVACLHRGKLLIDVAKSGGRAEYVTDQPLHSQPRKVQPCEQIAFDYIAALPEPELTTHLIDVAMDRALAAKNRAGSTFCAASHQDKLLALAYDADFRIKLWDLRSGRRIAALRHPGNRITGLVFTPDGSTLAAADIGGRLTLWDVARRREIHSIAAHSAGEVRVAVTRDGGTLATAGEREAIKLWDIAKGELICELHGDPTNDIDCIAFSPDGKVIAVGGTNRLVTLWSLETREKLGTLAGHAGRVDSLAFAPDGRLLASSGTDRSIRLWNLFTRQEVYALRAGSCLLADVAFTVAGDELTALGGIPQRNGWALHYWSAEGSSVDGRDAVNTAKLHLVRRSGFDGTTTPLDGDGVLDDLAHRFRRVSSWGHDHKYCWAFPTCVDEDSNAGPTLGVVVIKESAILRTDVYADELPRIKAAGLLGHDSRAGLQASVFRWSLARGYAAALVNFHQAEIEHRLAFGCHPFTAAEVDVKDVPVSELDDVTSCESRLRSVQRYARQNGYAGGFPNYVDATFGTPTIGVVLLRPAIAEVQSVPIDQFR